MTAPNDMVPDMTVEDLPDLELLAADCLPTDTEPRHAHTTVLFEGRRYCLEPSAIRVVSVVSPDDGVRRFQHFVSVCSSCFNALRRGQRAPKDSLVCIDPGLWSQIDGLEELSPLEELVIAPLRVVRQKIIKLYVGGNSSSPYPRRALRGHVIAFPQGSLADALNQTLSFPLHPDRLPEFIHVILIGSVQNEEEARSIAARATSLLRLRGALVVRWCLRQAQLYDHNPDLGLRLALDRQAMDAVALLDGVPQQVLHQALTHFTEEDGGNDLAAADLAGRSGYTANRHNSNPAGDSAGNEVGGNETIQTDSTIFVEGDDCSVPENDQMRHVP